MAEDDPPAPSPAIFFGGVLIVEEGGAPGSVHRTVKIERIGDRLHFWMYSGTFSATVADFFRCAERAGLGVSA